MNNIKEKEGVYTIIDTPIFDNNKSKYFKEVIGAYEDTNIYRWYYKDENIEDALSREPIGKTLLTADDRWNLIKSGKATYARAVYIKSEDKIKVLVFKTFILRR